MTSKLSFSARADLPGTHPLAAYLLHLMCIKQTNLCVSADVHSSAALLRLAEDVGDHICVLKTHADIVDDFGERTIKGLRDISRRKKFLIFEDRKFGDIGSTVQSQYTRGPLAIVTWAHLVNAHIFPGPDIITAMKLAAASTLHALEQSVCTDISAGTPLVSPDASDDDEKVVEIERGTVHPASQGGRKGSIVTATTTIFQTVETSIRTSSLSRPAIRRMDSTDGDDEGLEELGDPPPARALLLLAQMSSKGNLITADYTKACVESAREHTDFVLGFVSQQTLNGNKDNFISFTPGVSLPREGSVGGEGNRGDGLGQQYRTPEKVIKDDGCDIIIVGRGILGGQHRAKEAERYKRAAWKAYRSRLGKK